MKILMLSWEYPPKVIGGLARAVADLSQALVAEGHTVTVVTGDWPEAGQFENVAGVEVHRVNQFFPRPQDFLEEVHFINYHLIQKGIELLNKQQFDLIHAHDWLVAPSAKVLKHAFQKPLVATIHATEWGRNNGLHNELQRHISDLEWWLTYEAYGVICCSEYMRNELKQIFQIPSDKLVVIANGVRAEDFANTHPDLTKFRQEWALPEEQIVLYVGRHVYEKGIDLLLDGAWQVLEQRPQAKFIIAGTGPLRDEHQRRAWEMGLGEKVVFPGFVDDLTRNTLYQLADAAVFPSRYEPFGIVALEAMAGKVPVIVSDIGGFAETVQHGRNGLTFYSGNANSLADNILHLLTDPEFGRKLCQKAYQDAVEKFNWTQIAQETIASYNKFLPGQRQTKEAFADYNLDRTALLKGGRSIESNNHGRR